MNERWAEPVIPLEASEAGGVSMLVRGEPYSTVLFVLKPDDLERVRLGYVCVIELQPHEEPFPERCSMCGFPMRDAQREVFERLYQGEVRVGPGSTLADEWEWARDNAARERRARQIGPSQILVPRGLSDG